MTAALRALLVLLLVAAAGCDRTPLGTDGPEPGAGLAATYRGTLDRPDARFFAAGLPDQPCSRALLILGFGADTFEIECDVSDGIVQVQYRDVGPLAADRTGVRVTARSESGFLFEGTLETDSSRLDGRLQSPGGRSVPARLVRQ